MYQGRLTRDVWKEESPEQKQIVSLTATVEAQQKQLKGLQNWKKKRNKNESTTNSTPNKQQKNNEGKSRLQKAKERYENAPAWMRQRPANGKGTKIVEGKRYWWCPTHKMWVQHKPDECKLKKKLEQSLNNKQKKEEKKQNDENKQSSKPELKLDERLAMIAEEEAALDYNE